MNPETVDAMFRAAKDTWFRAKRDGLLAKVARPASSVDAEFFERRAEGSLAAARLIVETAIFSYAKGTDEDLRAQVDGFFDALRQQDFEGSKEES